MTAQSPAAPSGNALARLVADWSLNTKILAVVVVLSLVGGGVGAFAINQMAQLSASANELYSGGVVPTQKLEEIAVDMGSMRATALNHAISRNAAAKDRYEQVMQSGDAGFDADVAEYRPLAVDSALVDQLVAAWTQYRTVRDEQLVPASRAGNTDTVDSVRDSALTPAAEAAMAALNKLGEAENSAAEAAVADARQRYESAPFLTIWTLLA